MRVAIKIVLTLVVLFIATPISAVAKQAPFLYLILIAGIVGALIAIWRYNPEKTEDESAISKIKDTEDHQLDKS